MRWPAESRKAAKGRSVADLGRRSNRLRNKAVRPAALQADARLTKAPADRRGNAAHLTA